ncbi:MAG: glycosyltransferase involved in cell wall biosynthesis [Arcticibacterium sp.]
MKKLPLFSVIIPAYNYGHYISESIQSVLNQSFQDWECIVIDDGSKDNTAEVVKAFTQKDSRIKYHFQKNAGLSKARNRGISLAKGSYFQFLDADDLLESEKLRLFNDTILNHPEADVLYSEGRLFKESNLEDLLYNYLDLEQKEWTLDISGRGNKIIADFLKSNRFLVNMPVVRASIAKEILFDIQHLSAAKWRFAHENSHRFIQGNDDWDFWTRAAISGAVFLKIPYITGSYSLLRLHGGSMSTKQLQMISSQIVMRSKWHALIKDPTIKKENAKLLQLSILLYGIHSKIDGKISVGNRFIQLAIKSSHDFKYTLFSLISYLLPGKTAMNLLKKVTGQSA